MMQSRTYAHTHTPRNSGGVRCSSSSNSSGTIHDFMVVFSYTHVLTLAPIRVFVRAMAMASDLRFQELEAFKRSLSSCDVTLSFWQDTSVSLSRV